MLAWMCGKYLYISPTEFHIVFLMCACFFNTRRFQREGNSFGVKTEDNLLLMVSSFLGLSLFRAERRAGSKKNNSSNSKDLPFLVVGVSLPWMKQFLQDYVSAMYKVLLLFLTLNESFHSPVKTHLIYLLYLTSHLSWHIIIPKWFIIETSLPNTNLHIKNTFKITNDIKNNTTPH